MPAKLKHIAIFASGAGSNAKKIMEYFEGHEDIKVSLVVCNKTGAGVLQHAAHFSVATILIEKERFFAGDFYLGVLKEYNINFIVLAGFLWKLPNQVIAAFPLRIINIHPALLPNFGGKGMYGLKVHQAVLNAQEVQSGITIHYVDGHYDNGDIIFQASCLVEPNDTAEGLAEKIHHLEHRYYPNVIEDVLNTDAR